MHNQQQYPLAFLAVLVSLTAGTCGPTAQSIVPENYRSTYGAPVRACRLTIEHTSPAGQPTVTRYIQVYASPEARDLYLANAATLPAGSLIIKEEHRSPGCNSLLGYSVARKEPGFDPNHGDWHWQHVLANGTVDADGRVDTCSNSSCHGAAACVARDWMCTEP